MGSPVIFNGLFAKLLASGGLKLANGTQLSAGSLDPTVTATDGLKGDLYLSDSTGSTYQKQDSGSNTNWSVLAGGVSTFADLTDITDSQPESLINLKSFNPTGRYSEIYLDAYASANESRIRVADDTETEIATVQAYINNGDGVSKVQLNATDLLFNGQISINGTEFNNSFAGLTDLITAVVPAVNMTTENGGDWSTYSADTSTLSAHELITNATDASVYNYVQTASTYGENSLISDEVNDAVYTYQAAGQALQHRTYTAGATSLNGEYSLHVFTGDPGGNVTVNYLKQKNLFYVINQSGVSVTLAQNTTETFNGATTIVLLNNQSYVFIARTDGLAYHVFSSVNGTFAGLTDLASSSIATFQTTASSDIVMTTGGDFNISSASDIFAEATNGSDDSYVDISLGAVDIWSSDVTGDYGFAEVSPNYCTMEAYGDTLGKSALIELSAAAYARLEITANLSFIPKFYASAGTTALDTGHCDHVFQTTAPSGNVKVNYNRNSLFWVKNETASPIVFEATTTETFNGNATVTVPVGKTYRFKTHYNSPAYQVAPEGTLSNTDITQVIATTSSDITLTANNSTMLVDASGANRTITLPAAVDGKIFTIKKTDATANTVTIDGDAAETIDGATTLVLTNQWEAYTIQALSGAWYII